MHILALGKKYLCVPLLEDRDACEDSLALKETVLLIPYLHTW